MQLKIDEANARMLSTANHVRVLPSSYLCRAYRIVLDHMRIISSVLFFPAIRFLRLSVLSMSVGLSACVRGCVALYCAVQCARSDWLHT